ncbi:MAG: uroporphyrinogen-III C-methyltransferase [Rubrivivax sp.]|nr:uroporphyrinogen-III C-methyltransferase [Rubrivivax sp.]
MALGVLALLTLGALGLSWSTHGRVGELEAELVKRQQLSSDQAAEARIAARQAQEVARESAAKLALLEVRVAESAIQRTQLEALMQSVARSRDENVLADVEAALRVALQQGAITGSAEPLLAALKQAEERLARLSQPQLERVRRAIAADIEKTKAVAVADIATLTIRLDEAIRVVDDLPLLVRPEPRRTRGATAAAASAASAPASASAVPADWSARWRSLGQQAWAEVRGLVRVTPIEQPEAMLIAPEQVFFLRENLKLRLLNARLALLSRQFDTAQSDLRDARAALDRYFDRSARPVQSAADLMRQVMDQARLVSVPRPDATLAAIAAATAGR